MIDNISAVIDSAENPVEFSEIISDHFDGLSSNVTVSIGINYEDKKIEDIVEILRKDGIDAVPYYCDMADNLDCFVVDSTGIRTPYFSAEDALECTKDIYNSLYNAGIKINGYALPMNSENLTYYQKPRSDRQIDVVKGNADIEQFITHQLQTISEMEKFDVSSKEERPDTLYRGGTLGNQPYAITGFRCARNVCYATSDMSLAATYADGEYSAGVRYMPINEKNYGFIYEFDAPKGYKKYGEYGIETRQELKLDQKMYETPVFPHKNKLKAIYLKYGDEIVQIADEQGYINNEWKKFAQLHGVISANEKNDIMVNRANKLKKAVDAEGYQPIKYAKKQNLTNENIKISPQMSHIEQIQHFIFSDNISDNGQKVKDIEISGVDLPEAFKNLQYEGNITLNNVSVPEGSVFDLSKCENIILQNIDFSKCKNVILPKCCKTLSLKNVKFPENMKSLEIEQCDCFILHNQDFSTMDKVKLPAVKDKARFWGMNTMPKHTDVSNITHLTHPEEIANINFSLVSKLVTNDSSDFSKKAAQIVSSHRENVHINISNILAAICEKKAKLEKRKSGCKQTVKHNTKIKQLQPTKQPTKNEIIYANILNQRT